MAKPWAEVESNPEYQALPEDQKLQAKTQYFNDVVSSKPEYQSLPDENKAAAHNQFFSTPISQPKEPGMLEKIGSTADSVAENIVPGYRGLKMAGKAYDSVREPLIDVAEKTALIPKMLSNLTQKMNVPNPAKLSPIFAPFVPSTIQMSGKDIGRGMAGLGIDVVTGAGAEKAIAEGIPAAANLASKVGEGAKEMFDAGKNLKGVEGELASQPLKNLDFQNKLRDTRFTGGNQIDSLTQNFQAKNKILNQTLQDQSKITSTGNKSRLKSLFQNVSKTYKAGLENAEDALSARGETITQQDYLNNVVNKTVEDLKMKGYPEDSPAIQQIQSLSKNIKPVPNVGGADLNAAGTTAPYPLDSVSLDEIKNFKNSVYDTLSSGAKTGSAYADANDSAAMIFLRNHGQFIETKVPELASLNKEFAPMAQARQWASRNFKPWNDSEIQRGANVLNRIASSKIPNQTDLNYLKTLEEGSGRFKGSGSLRGSTTETGANINNLKMSFDTAKQNLSASTDYQINQLQNQMAELKKKGIELGFQRDRLKDLVNTRNQIISYTLKGIGTTGVGAAGLYLLKKH